MSEFKIIGTIDTLISTEKEVKFLMKFKNKYEDLNENKYIQDIVNFSKNNIEYILVYYSKNNGDLKINSHLFNKANINLDRFGLSKFKKFLLKEIYIYDEEEFEREFINKVIRDEP